MMKKTIKLLISIILPILILFLLFREINVSEISLAKISITLILFILISFFFIKLINTFRYAKVYNLKPSLKLYILLCYSNMMLSLVPLRLGEFSYLYGFKKYFNKSYKEGTQKLLLIRFADYIIVYFLLLISSIYVSTQVKQSYLTIISVFFVISLILGVGFFYWVSKRNYNFKSKKISNIFNILKEGVKNISEISKGALFFLAFSTLIYWSARLLMGYITLILLDVSIPFFYFIFISLLFLLVGLLPIQTFANFGIFEAGWSYFLVVLGNSYDDVLPLLLVYHFVLITPTFIYGVIAYFILKINLIRKGKFYNH